MSFPSTSSVDWPNANLQQESNDVYGPPAIEGSYPCGNEKLMMPSDIGLSNFSEGVPTDQLSGGNLDVFWEENSNGSLLPPSQSNSRNSTQQDINLNKLVNHIKYLKVGN